MTCCLTFSRHGRTSLQGEQLAHFSTPWLAETALYAFVFEDASSHLRKQVIISL